MSRRKEGTITAGFRCDEIGCSEEAYYAVIVCTPYLGRSRPPIMTFTDIHVCRNHWDAARREMVYTDAMKDAVRAIAAQNFGVADPSGAWLARIAVRHPDYHRFMTMAGLIPEDDAMVKGGPVIIRQ